MYSVMWSEHCSYKSSKVHLRQFGDEDRRDRCGPSCWSASARTPASSTSATGWAVTFKIESHNHPTLRRAVPGRGHRRRRHRPRHHRHGRAPGRGDGPAALRRHRPPRHRSGWCPASSPASAATATASACPTSAARSSSTPATRATRWSTRSASACCATRTSTWPTPPAPATRSSSSAPRTGGDGIGGVSILASETFDEGRPGQAARASRSATRSPRRCSSSAASSCSPPASSTASRTSAAPASPARPPSSPQRRRRHACRARPGAAARPHACGPRRSS